MLLAPPAPQAFRERSDSIKAAKMRIFVRRGGPNYKQGLDMMRRLGDEIGAAIEVRTCMQTNWGGLLSSAGTQLGGALALPRPAWSAPQVRPAAAALGLLRQNPGFWFPAFLLRAVDSAHARLRSQS